MNSISGGTNLPYMISGANSIPQKEVMEWATNRTYSFNSIVRALNNKKNNVKDNARYPLLQAQTVSKVLIVGGGNSNTEHFDAIREYILLNPNMPLIFVTSRYASYYNDLPNSKVILLSG